MKLYRKGEKGEAVCEECAKLVSTTFDYRDVPFEDGLGTVMGIFIICWFPFFLVNVVSGILSDVTIPEIVFQVVTWLGWLNSSMNPFIYACCSKDFRR